MRQVRQIGGSHSLFRLLIAVVVLSPLPLGSHRPWAWSLLGIAVGLLLLLWAWACLRGSAQITVPAKKMLWLAVPFGLALSWAALQTFLPLPVGWTHPLQGEAQAALGQAGLAHLSLDPSLGATALFRLIAYAGVFWLAAQLGRDRAHARLGIKSLAVCGTVYGAYGLTMHLSGIEQILWLDKWAYLGDLTATFVNRNAYGAYAGLGILCCLALVLHALRHRHRASDFNHLANHVAAPAIFYSIGVILLATALLFTHSRGAFLSTIVAIVVLVFSAILAGIVRSRVTGLVLVVLLGCGFASLFSMAGEGTAQRLWETAELSPDEARPYLYSKTLEAIADSPWSGTGMGTFQPTYRMYRHPSLSSPLLWEFAHNIYLENALDLGLVQATLFFAVFVMIVLTCVRGLRVRRRDQIFPALAIAATTLLGCHGLVDFSAQIPAIAVTLSFLLGIGFAQSWPTADLPPVGNKSVATTE